MTTTRTYQPTDLGDLTLGDAFLIRSKTGVDVFNPPTGFHRNAALLWHASQETDQPLSWDVMKMKTAAELAVYLPEDEADDDTVPESAPLVDEGKVSTCDEPSSSS